MPKLFQLISKWLFVISFLYISWQMLIPTPYTPIEVSDKLIHFLCFGWLALTLDWGWYQKGQYWLVKLLPLLVYGALIEAIQHFVPGRSMSFGDWIADSGGVLLYPVGMVILIKMLALVGSKVDLRSA